MSLIFIVAYCLLVASVCSAESSTLHLKPTDPLIELRGGRYNFQPSEALNKKDILVAAFDFQGFTIAAEFSGATSSAISLYQKKERKHGGVEWWNRFNVTLFEMTETQEVFLHQKILSTRDQPTYAAYPTNYTLFTGLTPSKRYRLVVLKISEPNWRSIFPDLPNFVELHGVTLIHEKGGTRTTAIASPTAHNANRRHTRRIEFIGDSITCGFCNLCHVEPNANNDVDLETFALAWPHLTCEALNADCHIEAWSGYGMARNCCGGTTIMPDIFNRTLATVESSVWNFTDPSNSSDRRTAVMQSKWESPQAVVINLGTNDFFLGSNITAQYEANYEVMLRQIVHYYGPEVQIFTACGPMTDVYCDAVHRVLHRTAGWAKTHFLDQRNILTNATTCCGHPDIVGDATMADITVKRIKEVMGW